ncbi:MAG: PAS domain S-box protein [Nannocystaceae bacterium]|nr:PAS domain S-box protein [Nannocystaceae bacterium]
MTDAKSSREQPQRDWIVRLVQATQDAVITIDGDSRIVLFNASAEAMFGYTAAEVEGKDVSLLMPQPYRAEHSGYVVRYEHTGKPHAIGRIRTVTAQRKNGEAFPIELSVTEVPDGQGTRYGAFIRDISDKVRLERELVERERLAAIGTTAAKFAHEVSNPLNGMYTQVQLMQRRLSRDSDADPRIASGVEHLRSDLERLNTLLDEFRSMSRRQDYRREPVSLPALCKDLISDRAELHSQRHIVVTSEFPVELPRVQADSAKLTQVLLNLCKNAEEAMPDGGTLQLGAVQHENQVVISITDSGMGVPEGVDVFEPFATTKPDGTGLGLPIVREIVAAHDGTVTYRSTKGQGTTFIVTLPIAGPT